MKRVCVILFLLQALIHDTHQDERDPICTSYRKWDVENTIYETQWANFDLYVVASCKDSAFRIEGNFAIRCINGNLEQELPHCRKVKCGDLPVPDNGHKFCDSRAPEQGSKCNFTCENTHYFIGSRRRTCAPNLEWTGSKARCVIRPECPVPPPLVNGTVRDCSKTRIPRFGDVCHFKCNFGFVLVGPSELACRRNGKLTDRNGNEMYPTCVDSTDPCTMENGHCSHYCHSNQGVVRCSCHEGFKLLEDGRKCVDINECSDNTHHCQQICSNTYGSYICSCNNGYRLEGKFYCEAYNTQVFDHTRAYPPRRVHHPKPPHPCQSNNGGCEQVCVAVSGFVNCRCDAGYELERDGKKCKSLNSDGDIQEKESLPEERTHHSTVNSCELNNGGCVHNCQVTNGVVQCSCRRGHRLRTDNKTCADINECSFDNFGCSDTCTNTRGGAFCSCPRGYQLQKDGKKCAALHSYRDTQKKEPPPEERTHHSNVNPCELNNGGCLHNCQVTNGVVQCSCRRGYMLLRDNKRCFDINECSFDNFGCSDICTNTQGGAFCSCPRGFQLQEDRKQCADIDECAESTSNNCHQRCHNTIGNYTCSCEPGFVPINDYKCEGCRVNSYRSDTDVSCVDCPLNSYTDSDAKTSIADCTCHTGFYRNPQRDELCIDINECDIENFGCSDKCMNTPGNAHCSCPLGFELQEDEKTCSDIDECNIKNGGCQGICHNSLGNFSCSCPEGYTVSKSDRYSCDDVDECMENSGGCSDICVNFLGGYHCSCPDDSQLGTDGKSCITVHCPEVPVPYHTSLRCFHKNNRTSKTTFEPGELPESVSFPVGTLCRLKCSRGYAFEESSRTIECQRNGRWNTTLPECVVLPCPALEAPENGDVYPPECKEGFRTVKKKCYFTCHPGYRLKGKPVFTCKNKLSWNNDTIPVCQPESISPVISCPEDVIVDLLPNENTANVTLQSPQTNVEDLQVSPDWISIGKPTIFPSGKTDITFTATNSNFDNQTISCITTVFILDKEAPEFFDCPYGVDVNFDNAQGGFVVWREPVAYDNVGIQSVFKSLEPNSTLTPGIHVVEYVAQDFAGNAARCSFEINVTSTECGYLADPENGEANCMDWMFGQLCEPSCNPNYTRSEDEAQFFVCDDTGTWSPSNVVSPCLPECADDEIWSQYLEQCVGIAMNITYTATEHTIIN